MTTRPNNWQRVSRAHPCPVCGRPDWCVFVGPHDAPEVAICARVESPKRIGEAGWLHRLSESTTAWPRWRSTIRRAVKLSLDAQGGPDFGRLVEEWRLPDDSTRLVDLATRLGVSVRSLARLRTGWSDERRAWTFPMLDPTGRVLGIRLRVPSGRKLSVRGGKEGLFIPEELSPGSDLYIAEGPTDTAALLDLGLDAAGRPSCTGGTAHLTALVRRPRPGRAVIVADADDVGQAGARRLATTLRAYVPDVRVITPPTPHKDARAWVRDGGTRGDVLAAVEAAETVKLAVTSRRRERRKARCGSGRR
jgi:hypothetical protein